MDETTKKGGAFYEVSYLIVSSIPEEKIVEEVESIKNAISKEGANIVADENPHLEPLAYTMKKKTVSGSYDKYDEAHFGWVKFEVGKDKIGAIKNALDKNDSILRFLIVSTVKENTYLGKRASQVAQAIGMKGEGAPVGKTEEAPKKDPSASIEDMDKSIDEMVKEV